MVKIPMLINIIFNHADLWDDVGKHTHSIFVLGIEYGGKKRTRSQGKLVAWYYDSIEKKKDALIGKSFHKRGHKKTRVLAPSTHMLLELSRGLRTIRLAQSQSNLGKVKLECDTQFIKP